MIVEKEKTDENESGNKYLKCSCSLAWINISTFRIDILYREAAATRDGLQMAWQQGIQIIQIETDSKAPVDLLFNKASMPWRTFGVFQNILYSLAYFFDNLQDLFVIVFGLKTFWPWFSGSLDVNSTIVIVLTGLLNRFLHFGEKKEHAIPVDSSLTNIKKKRYYGHRMKSNLPKSFNSKKSGSIHLDNWIIFPLATWNLKLLAEFPKSD